MKQSAVDWFAKQLGITKGSMLQKAKEIEKEQQEKEIDEALKNYHIGDISEMNKLSEKYPNDQDLGKAVRKYCNSKK